MTHLAPDPHFENAVARGPGRGERVTLLSRCVPRVLASQGGYIVTRFTAPRVPFIGGERPAHEGHAARAFAGRIGLAGDGDGPAAGIGAGRVVEFDPSADSRTLGAMGTGSHAEGRPVVSHLDLVWMVRCSLDRQVGDRAGQVPVVHRGGRKDQVLVQPGHISSSGLRHP